MLFRSTLIKSLKITWVKRVLKSKGSWQDLFNSTVSDDELIWELDTESLIAFASKVTNKFWKEVLLSWLSYREKEAKENHMYYPIWNADFCQIEGIVKRKKEFQEKGLNYVRDLFQEGGSILGYQEFIDKYKININFVDFYSLVHSLKHEWKKGKAGESSKEVKDCVEKTLKAKKVCKYVYSLMVQKLDCLSTNKIKWSNIGINMSEDEWKKCYKIPKIASMEYKIQSFQYQILKRSLVTNKFLYLCKIKDSSNCYFCKNEVETIKHLLYDCQVVKRFWNDLCNIMPEELKFRNYCNRKSVLVGETHYRHNALINQIIILAKRYIYVSKCLDKHINRSNFMHYLKGQYNVEIGIANKEQKKHLSEKWNIMKTYFDSI